MTNRYLIAHYAICLLVGLIAGCLSKHYLEVQSGTHIGLIIGLAFVATSFIKIQIEGRIARPMKSIKRPTQNFPPWGD